MEDGWINWRIRAIGLCSVVRCADAQVIVAVVAVHIEVISAGREIGDGGNRIAWAQRIEVGVEHWVARSVGPRAGSVAEGQSGGGNRTIDESQVGYSAVNQETTAAVIATVEMPIVVAADASRGKPGLGCIQRRVKVRAKIDGNHREGVRRLKCKSSIATGGRTVSVRNDD